jgi:hypothetical protein
MRLSVTVKFNEAGLKIYKIWTLCLFAFCSFFQLQRLLSPSCNVHGFHMCMILVKHVFICFAGQSGPHHHLHLQMVWLLLWHIDFHMLYVYVSVVFLL